MQMDPNIKAISKKIFLMVSEGSSSVMALGMLGSLVQACSTEMGNSDGLMAVNLKVNGRTMK